MTSGTRRVLGALVALSTLGAPLLLPSGALSAQTHGPRAAGGRVVQIVARGLATTTAFAFGGGAVFASEEPPNGEGGGGGVYAIGAGRPRLVYATPAALGVVWHRGALYVSAMDDLVRLSGWNGRRFASATTLYSGPPNFTGLSGIGFGADGRLYAGVYLGTNDHSPTSAPYAFDVLSFDARGGNPRVVARGIRQPWQLAFPAGSSSPYVSVLGQDEPVGIVVPDLVVRVRPGANFGFPTCTWATSSPCTGYTRPARLFSTHTDVGGLAVLGTRLIASEFGFSPRLHAPRVVSIPLGRPGNVKTLISGFSSPIVGLGVSGGWIYVGDYVGNVYRTRL